MLVLGFDTALQSCSVAIMRDGKLLAEVAEPLVKGHAERLAPMVAEALSAAGVAMADVDRVGVVVGPGGFTGVRVGLAFARGAGVGGKIEVVGVTSLAALAANVEADAETLIAPVIDARRGQVYAALYGANGDVRAAPFVATPEEAAAKLKAASATQRVLTVGTGAPLLPASNSQWSSSAAPDQLDAKIVARLAAAAPTPAAPPAPLYLRGPDAKPQAPSRFRADPAP